MTTSDLVGCVFAAIAVAFIAVVLIYALCVGACVLVRRWRRPAPPVSLPPEGSHDDHT